MSALRTGRSSAGEESVKAGDGLDEAATNSATPAMAASKPVGTRRETIISSALPKGTVFATRYPAIGFRKTPASTSASGQFVNPDRKTNGYSFAGAGTLGPPLKPT
jgi:hypothetical protein